MSSMAAIVLAKIALCAPARIDERDVDVPLPQLEPERVGDRLHRELRRAVPAVEREHESAADRPDVHEPALARANQREERLGHRDLPEQVDLELRAGSRPSAGTRAGRAARSRRCSPGRPDPRSPTACATVSAAAAIIAGVGDVDEQRREGRQTSAAAVARRRPRWRTPANTANPASARRSAHAAPMPVDVPVMTTAPRSAIRTFIRDPRGTRGRSPQDSNACSTS